MFFNVHTEPMEFTLPAEKYGKEWTVVLNTTDAVFADKQEDTCHTR
jgi:glycogen operon protein